MSITSLARVSVMAIKPGHLFTGSRGKGAAAVASSQDQRGLLTVLSILAYAVVQALALVVTAGVLTFINLFKHPHNEYQRSNGGMYLFFACFAAVVLLVPIASLCMAAARMGAMRRARRLAILRMIGASPSAVRAVGTIEAVVHAVVGAVIGIALYLISLPVWSALSFEGERLEPHLMWLGVVPLLIVTAVVLVLAVLSAVAALHGVVISPLGVSRRVAGPQLRRRRALISIGALLLWFVVGGLMGQLGPAIALIMFAAVLAGVMAGVNAAGPLLVQGLGRTMVNRAAGAPMLIAGRRLVEDPKSTWRSVSALSMACFIVSVTAIFPMLMTAVRRTPEQVMFFDDLRTGMYLTLAITFILTAVSTGLNQAAKTVDRNADARVLMLTGAPIKLLAKVRRREVLAPVAVAVIVPTVLGLLFQAPLLGPAFLSSPLAVASFIGSLVIGVLLVFGAQELCGLLQRRLLREQLRAAD